MVQRQGEPELFISTFPPNIPATTILDICRNVAMRSWGRDDKRAMVDISPSDKFWNFEFVAHVDGRRHVQFSMQVSIWFDANNIYFLVVGTAPTTTSLYVDQIYTNIHHAIRDSVFPESQAFDGQNARRLIDRFEGYLQPALVAWP
jgi:hypothetical protein